MFLRVLSGTCGGKTSRGGKLCGGKIFVAREFLCPGSSSRDELCRRVGFTLVTCPSWSEHVGPSSRSLLSPGSPRGFSWRQRAPPEAEFFRPEVDFLGPEVVSRSSSSTLHDRRLTKRPWRSVWVQQQGLPVWEATWCVTWCGHVTRGVSSGLKRRVSVLPTTSRL